MKSRQRTALSLFLSVVLAFGTVPAPALAEMGEEATATLAASDQGSHASGAQAIAEWLEARLGETKGGPAYVRCMFDALTTLYAGTAVEDTPPVSPGDAREAAEAVVLACAARSIEAVVVCEVPSEGGSTSDSVWNMVRLDGSWYHVDVMSHAKEIEKRIQEPDQHRYLLVSDETIRANDGRGAWVAKDGDQTPAAQKDYVFAQPVEQPTISQPAERPAVEQPAETPAADQPIAPQPTEQPAAVETPAATPQPTEQPAAVETPAADPQPADKAPVDTNEPAKTPAAGSQAPEVAPNEDEQAPSEQTTPPQREKDQDPVGAYKPTSLEPQLAPQLAPESLAPNSDSDFITKPSGSGVEITGYSGSGGHVVIPATIGGSKVVSIGEQSFREKSNITEVTIPATVTKVGKQAFAYCSNLSSLHLPTSGLSEIGEAAFYGTGLTSVSIPGCVKTLDTAAFGNCYSLGNVQLGDGLKTIGAYAFQYSAITSISIPRSVEQIGGDSPQLAFYGASSLSTVTVDSSNASYSVRDGILYNKSGTVLYLHPVARQSGTVQIPNGVTTISSNAFFTCSGITEVVIPPSVTSVGDWAFAQSSVTRGTIPATVAQVGNGPFDGCYALTEVSYQSPATVPYRFCEGCHNLTTLDLGSQTTVIDGRAFCECNLTRVYIPDSVTKVEFNAFSDNKNLATVEGARSLERIEYWAFSRTGISSFPWGNKLRYVSGVAFSECPNFPNPNYPTYLTKGDDGSYWVYDDNFTIGGTCDYDMAKGVLDIVNRERSAQGLSPLAMDSDLQEAAMRRAAECSLYFEHSRPNGSDCFSLSAKANGENIAAGSSTAEGVMDQWMNSAGHRSNILTSSFQSIGVGCIQIGAMHYWVQMFGGGAAEGSAGSGRRNRKFDIDVMYSVIPLEGSGFNLNEAHGETISLVSGETKELTVGVPNPGWSMVYGPIDGSSFTWASSNPNVARVNSNGVVTAGQQTGVCTITATSRGGHTWSIGIESRRYSISYVYPWADGMDWSAVFDADYYAAQNPDVRAWAQSGTVVDGDKLLSHFVNSGAKEGRRSKASFELASYFNANPDLRRAFGTSDWSRYYRHYATSGARENRTCKGVGSLRGHVTSRDGVDWSPVYDGAYYAQRNPDVASWATRRFASGSVVDDAALLQHFVSSGTRECRSGKAGFDVRSYYNANPDLRAAFGGSADWSKYYRHYATNGARENRKCSGANDLVGSVNVLGGTNWSAVYDRAYYGQRNADVVKWATRKCGSATVLDDYAMLTHFVNNGRKEGRASKQSFELVSYYYANPDLRRAFGADWARYYDHYRSNGQREGRTCLGVDHFRGMHTLRDGVDWAPVYNAYTYAINNPDVSDWATRTFASGVVLDDVALLQHFVDNGMREARFSKVGFDVRAYKSKNADLARAFGDDWKSYYRHYAKFGVNEHRPCV